MFRRYWREPAFWLWWWGNRLPYGAKVSLAGVAVIAVLGAGFLAAVSLSDADAGARLGTSAVTFEKLVTVRDHGRVVIKRVPVVRRIVLRPRTALETLFDTRVITTRGRVRYVPLVRKRVVTVGGKTRTITETRLVPTTKTQTKTQTQTQTRTQTQTQIETTVVTQQQTVVRTETVQETVVETQTLPPKTVTETLPVTVTVTVPTVTVP